MTGAPPGPAGAGRAALAGLVCLAVAMGIGRFAFTPILPLMLHDGVVDLAAASWLASANYIGYLAGALLCAGGPWLLGRLRWRRRPAGTAIVRAGLVATAVLTMAMALPAPALWPLWRFAAGVASAFVLVYSTGWCLAVLAGHGRSELGGVMFAGPGAGIVASGLLAGALVGTQAGADTAWLVFAALAALLTAAVWPILGSDEAGAVATAELLGVEPLVASPAGPKAVARAVSSDTSPDTLPASSPDAASSAQIACLALAYGLAGLGYIVTATFLPVIARSALPGSPALDLFWPIFGIGAFAGALLATRLRTAGDLRRTLAAAYAIQAAGIGIGLVVPSDAGFAVGSLLLGLPFTAITFFALQEGRRLRPATAASTFGLLSATFGVGQIIGPPMVSVLVARSGDASAGFRLSLEVAASALVAGAGLYLIMARRWPMPPRRSGA